MTCHHLRERFSLPEVVEVREHLGTHDGCELGFACTRCKDGIMGVHPRHGPRREFR